MRLHLIGQRQPGDRHAGLLIEGFARLLRDEKRRPVALRLGLGAERPASLDDESLFAAMRAGAKGPAG